MRACPERNPKWKPKETSINSHERLKYQNVANTIQMRDWSAKAWQIPCKMEGEHGRMWRILCMMQSNHANMFQIPCNMTDSSSKLLETAVEREREREFQTVAIQGKWFLESNKKKQSQKKQTIMNPLWRGWVSSCVRAHSAGLYRSELLAVVTPSHITSHHIFVGTLDPKLMDRLEDIARQSGSVPLHGRLFAQRFCWNWIDRVSTSATL